MDSVDLPANENRYCFKARGKNKKRQLSRYFWDGRRFWISGDGSRYTPLRATRLPDHLKVDGVQDIKAEIKLIKEKNSINAALPIALHSAGDLIQIRNGRVLCTDDILPVPEGKEGDFPFISGILNSVLGQDADRFVKWIAKAVAYTRGESAQRPEIPCLVGVCDTRKGILANLANMVLIDRWSPHEISVLSPRMRKSEIGSLAELVWVLNMSSCRATDKACERNLRKLIAWSEKGTVVTDVELKVRKVIIIRCHSSFWKPLHPIVERNAPNGMIVFHAKAGLHLHENGEAMSPMRIEQFVHEEIRQFRHHVLSKITEP